MRPRSIKDFEAELNPAAVREAADPSKALPPAPLVWAWSAMAVVVFVLILAFTPYTNNLDDIKVTILHIGGGGLLCLFAWLWLRNEIEPPSRLVMGLFGAYIGSMFLSTILHETGLVPDANRFQWVGWIMIGQELALLGIFLIFASTLRTVRMVEISVFFWVLVILVQCAFGLIHYGGGLKMLYRFLYFDNPPPSLFASLLYTFNSSRDMLGTILNRQFFGDLLGLWAPLALAGVVIWKDRRRRLLSMLALLLSAPCTYLTFSKAALPFYAFGVVVAALCIWLFMARGSVRIPHLPWLVGGAALVAATLMFLTWHEIEGRFKTVDFSLHSRGIIWGGGMAIFEKYPIIGGGPGCFRVLFPEYRSPDYHLSQISNLTLSAHNRFVDLLAEGGVIGFTLYMAMLCAIFWQGIRVLRHARDNRLKVVSVALMSGIVAYLGASFFHPGIRWIIGMTPYYAMLGMLAGLPLAEQPMPVVSHGGKRRRAAPLEPRQKIIRVAALAAAVIVWINPLPFSKPFFFSNFGYGIRYFAGSKSNNDGLLKMTIADNKPSPIVEQAIDDFTSAVKWNPTFVTSYYKRAHAENLISRYEDSLNSYAELMQYAPHYSEVHYNLGIIQLYLADQTSRRAARASSEEERAKLEKESIDLVNRSRVQFGIAAKMCNKISIQYQYAMCLENSARLSLVPEEKSKFYAEAAQILERIPSLALTVATQEENQLEQEREMQAVARRKAPLLYQRAADTGAGAGADLLADAGRAYFKAFQAEPARVDYLRQAAECYKQAGKPEKAREILEQTLARSPLSFEARNLLANLLASEKDGASQAEALKHSRILLALDAKYPGKIPDWVRKDNAERMKKLGAPKG